MKRAALALLWFLAAPAFAWNLFADFGGVCDGVADVSPAFNNAVAAAIASPSDKVVSLPAGNCVFYSKPATLRDGVAVIGQGKSVTVLRRAYNGSFFTLTGQGVRLEHLTIYADQNTSGGVGVEMLASEALGAGGNHVLRHLWVTGRGTWVIPLGAWGQDKTTAPIGIRTVYMSDVNVFNATYQALTLWHCHACEWVGGGAYQGFGTTQQVVIGPGTNVRVDANYDRAQAVIYPGVLRAP